MGFYTNIKKEEDSEVEKEDNALEEQYQKMYKKIARDFVHLKDFQEIMLRIIENKSFVFALANALKRENAINTALEYKKNLETSKNNRKKYKDIIQEEINND